ncbi:phosphopyruvate hydratase [Alkalihalobacillus oceani]|uniref:phosphopyruvate hydratase n=1 Tax=Halalkalibacter oceani TaxID=1653776 RepID=UPI00203DC631|nr:phosphopyruvate hydratase [Halalkalibacter oceani]MCM3761387.1 phosphopyruvate hydratase [Halalkalibacter oceani]
MNPFAITEIKARQVFDSRSVPTVEVDVHLAGGGWGRGTVPSGASTGKFEALELRDENPDSFQGKGVYQAIGHVESIIAPALLGLDATDQVAIDQLLCELDGTENKSRLGANSILAVSMAVAWAAARGNNVPLYRYLGGANAKQLPMPMIQIIGGGAHARATTDLQDYLVIPVGSTSFSQGYEMVVNVYQATKKVFQRHGKPLATADEGGFWPTGFSTNEEGLQLLVEGIEEAGYQPGKEVAIALDIASSEFYQEDGSYRFALEDRSFTRDEFIDYLCELADLYPILSIEDGMAETDWEGSRMLTERVGKRLQLIGDDLFTTSVSRIQQGVRQGVYNSVLIKMNQIGTITETLDAIESTKSAGYLPVISARSGETEDTTIVHLAIATNAGQLKVGSVARSERTVKWNEVLRIEEELGASACYAGRDLFNRILS